MQITRASGEVTNVGWQAVGFRSAPTPASHEFEFQIDLSPIGASAGDEFTLAISRERRPGGANPVYIGRSRTEPRIPTFAGSTRGHARPGRIAEHLASGHGRSPARSLADAPAPRSRS
jgi:hypothetical protein